MFASASVRRLPGLVRLATMAALVAGLAVAAGTSGATTQSASAASAATRSSSAAAASAAVPGGYLGMWNYDQPDRRTMVDYAVISCPAGETGCASMPPIVIPQIGYVAFSTSPGGAVIGHTDQGCSWRFAVVPGGLELSPAQQYCFNHVVGSGYTITRWSVRFSGRHETETVDAISHLPQGDFDFVLQDGRRTKSGNRPAAKRFTGLWRYDPANQATGVNMQTIETAAAGGAVTVSRAPMTGTVMITGVSHLITARTGDGCQWTLSISGNTAELAPATQTCDQDGAITTFRFWSIASDGHHQISIITGTYPDGSTFQLTNGSLTRQRRSR
jgi:hypothetical protein